MTLAAAEGRHDEEWLYWLIGEDYYMCRGEFDHLVAFQQERDNVAGLSMPKEDQCILVTRTGARFETHTARDPRKLGVKAPHGVIGCEVGLWTDKTWERARGRMAEKRAWGIFTGSFEGAGSAFHQWWDIASKENGYEMCSFSLPTWSNTIVYPRGWEDPEIQALRSFFPEERFMERFGGIPARPSGLVLKLMNEGHVDADLAFDPMHPVQLWIDPGFAHAYAVLAAQLVEDEVRLIDELYLRGRTHQEVVRLMRSRDWSDNVTLIVMDEAGRQRNANGESCHDTWRYELDGIEIKTNRIAERDTIDRVNSFLLSPGVTGLPRLRVSPRCRGLLAEAGVASPPDDMKFMKAWRYKTRPDGSAASEAPVDEFNDAAKALGYGLVANFGLVLDNRGVIPTATWFEAMNPRPARPFKRPEGTSDAEAWMQDRNAEIFGGLEFDLGGGLWAPRR